MRSQNHVCFPETSVSLILRGVPGTELMSALTATLHLAHQISTCICETCLRYEAMVGIELFHLHTLSLL